MITLLKRAAELNLFNALDLQLAIRLVEDENPLLLLIFALLSAETRAGHVCLFIDKLQPFYLFEGRQVEMAFALWEMAGSPDSCRIYAELKQCHAVCDAQQSAAKPLVLSGNKLYFQRMWADEGLVADFFSRHLLETVDEQRLATILTHLFTPSNTPDWQKIAVAVAVTSRIAVISGGPGTGKTTTVARLLATLVKLSHEKLIIQLAAPTGKAAARLTESLSNALLKLNLTATEQAVMPEQAQTIHRLLGAQPDSQLLRYHKDNPLLLDVLIVDEASMIDLPMMARLIEALPGHARVILLGDRDQLASVEAGAVLGDLCRFSACGYSRARAAQLTEITDCDLSDFISNEGPEVKDRICLLRKSYRFDAQSGIGRLATAINQGNIKHVEQLLTQQSADIAFYSVDSSEQYGKLLSDAAACYLCYLDMIKAGRNPEEILTTFNRYRLLAALRDGPFGVIGLNDKLEQLLHRQGSIRRPAYSWNKNYEGRPIMITKNDRPLGLFNGDIGIMLRDGQQGLKAYFQLPNGVVKRIQPSRLPQHETAFVMTVHKSQGSEFEHAALVLPPIFTPIISKELIYTAITRAKNQLTIYADRHVFAKALVTPTERRSGLTERLV
ncbi:exodeoxyribonuclease V subunit alpha [Arsenophonus nasoniae]|uniref:RecBCD enzyme subunit RecD n=4 Tax=Arsenophonus nasoniae TaxID=638 RepID=A0A4P7KPZ7_9GAMM|nr:exodeoxyribonuclease V subunit alpha [Arsenophonus nasoniae]QBY42057.1 RecBCD enzyme subunit RecD [Arsenophonus nasoniae]WGM02010.1 exodeoxyribonuclease V subunit alpha [Arsenophonus nasoniae]WGM06241.1 exodeoxyribonuclease V subunit alpha [Arsenophonus nasoniae]WGM11176.1 exodeoxyribonuclease V subunit alpha [Arsenophonus nasoniae]WGM15875.1 exodeoxyribonuclease V subunit alpha [Arsenophonus nasoniae]